MNNEAKEGEKEDVKTTVTMCKTESENENEKGR